MKELFSKNEVKVAERLASAGGVSEEELVMRAAKSVVAGLDKSKSYAIVCGKGNNGADGFCIALLLNETGANVSVFYLFDKMTEAERQYYEKCLYKSINVQKFENFLPDSDVILDCVFGIGFHGELSCEALVAVDMINEKRERGAKVYSVDIPSGLDADTGMAEKCVVADKTFVIGKYKTGVILAQAKDVVGEIIFCDIGLVGGESCAKLVEDVDFKTVLKDRKNFSNKYDHGFVGIMGGSKNYSGAVKLSNIAACAASSGAGVVRLIVGEEIADWVAPYILESTLTTVPSKNGAAVYDESALDAAIKRLNSLSVGMGMTDCEETGKIVEYLLKNFYGTLVIDADGLNSIKDDVSVLKNAVCKKVVLTPHVAEFSRLIKKTKGEIEQDPIGLSRAFAKKHGVILLLKGTATIVTDGSETLVVSAGTAGMATAGSGDVLSGVLAAMVGYSEPGVLSVACAAQICGRAAEIAERDISPIAHTASDTVKYIKQALTEISRSA